MTDWSQFEPLTPVRSNTGAIDWSQFELASKPPKSPGLMGHAADTGLQLAQGVLQGGEMLANTFGADNPVSETLRKGHQWLASNFSDQLKWEQLTTAQEMDAAAKSGSTWEEVKAAAKGFGRDPVGFLVNAAGTSIPTIAAAFLPGGQGALLGRLAAMGAAGAAQGAGAVKGQIYSEVEKAWKESGASDEEAKTRAAAAQEYLGSNAGQIAIGTALGALAGATGLEGGLAAKTAGQGLAKQATGMIPRFVKEGVKEAIPEALQGGQEQLAGNLALQNEGLEKDTWSGVAGGATLEGLAGGLLGGAASPVHAQKPTLPPGPTGPQTAPPADPTEPAGPAPALGYDPDPFVSFPDGTVGKRADVDAYVQSLPESERLTARAKLFGLAPQPADPLLPILAAENVDDAVEAAMASVDAVIRDAVLSPAKSAEPAVIADGRTWERDMAQIAADADLARTNLRKQAELDAIPTLAAEQDAAQQAVIRASTLEGDTPFAAALRRAMGQQEASQKSDIAPATQPEPAAPSAAPRIVERTPDMRPMSLAAAQKRAETLPGSEVVAMRNLSGKLAYTVLPPKQTAVQPGDLTTGDGFPYGTKAAAFIRAKKEGEGFAPVEVPGGFVVRKTEPEVQSGQPVSDLAMPATATAGSGDVRGDQLGGGQPDLGSDVAQPAGRVAGDAAGPGVGSDPTGAAGIVPGVERGDGGVAAGALSGDSGGRPLPALEGKRLSREWTAFAPDSGTLNIPRSEMPQIRAEHRGAMVNFLNARGIDHESAEVPAADLKPTQAEFSPAKVQKAIQFTGGDRSILVSSDGHVLDGHHQWMAKREAGEPVKIIRLNAPIKRLLSEVKDFPSVQAAAGAGPVAASQPNPEKPPPKSEAQSQPKPETLRARLEKRQTTLAAEVARKNNPNQQRIDSLQALRNCLG